MSHQKVMTDYLQSFIDGLVSSGITKAVISPGSRSTPMALLMHHDPRIDYFVDVDERSAAFFALGLAKASHQAVALLCTSGTAAANYYPALCEATASHVPLVVITTDRPPELRNVGAPQAMNQQELFGKQVKEFIEMTVPENTPTMLRYSQWQAKHATQLANQAPQGPVHINIPLREPLLPDLSQTVYTLAQSVELSEEPKVDLAQWQSFTTKKGIIIVGDERTSTEARLLLDLADRLGWPILGDPLTNLANCGKLSPNYMRQADLSFSALSNQPEFIPEVVLRFGRLPLTKNVMVWLMGLPEEQIQWVLVDEGQEWLDQLQRTDMFLPYSVSQFCKASVALTVYPENTRWITQWQQLQKAASREIVMSDWTYELSETSLVRKLPQVLSEGTQLFVSNSNAIRMLDRFGESSIKPITIYGNRGVNGIDGIVSTAAGIAAATNQPTVLVTGDLALFHDMNGLQMIKAYQLPVTIVLLNNQGGGIFSFLSQRTLDKSEFDPLFATPLHLAFSKVAELYGASYHQPASLSECQALFAQVKDQTEFRLIEVTGTFSEPVAIWEEIVVRFSGTFGGKA